MILRRLRRKSTEMTKNLRHPQTRSSHPLTHLRKTPQLFGEMLPQNHLHVGREGRQERKDALARALVSAAAQWREFCGKARKR